jgi:hypothetical protein
MLAKLFFNEYMIELTTGVIFLMSSMYGSAQGANHTKAIVAGMESTVEQANESVLSSLTSSYSPKEMEAYLRKEFADTPVLVDIARCESNFRHYDEDGMVVRGHAVPDDIGVMQINEHFQGSTAKKLGIDIYTLEGNVAYAKHLYEEQGSQPWKASSKCWNNDLAKR